jgi:hypothetical protein
MNIISLNQLIQIFKDFAEAHLQLNDFGYGDTSMIGTSRKMDPAYMWITHRTSSTIGVTNKTQIPEMVLTFIIVDKINQQKNYEETNGYESNNEQEILSDTFQIMQDLINFISVYLGKFGVMLTDEPINPEIVQDETTDKVTGWMCDIRLKLIHSNCISPVGNITINVPTQHQVQQEWITCNNLGDCNTFQTYAYTGGTFTGSTLTLNSLNGNSFSVSGFTGGGGTGFTWVGTWTLFGTYVVGDVVEYNGSSYICIQNTNGQAPTDTAYWSLMVQGATYFYGSFYDTTTQTNSGATIANVMRFNTFDFANGVSIVDGSKITIANAGKYNIQFSAQFDKTDSGKDDVEVWLSVNNSDLSDSSTILSLDGNNAKVVASWNFFVNASANDYFELKWHSNDTDLRILSRPSGSNPTRPAIPSIILTVNKIG